jgi:hypothetical protein
MESRKETLGLLLVDVARRMRRAFQQQLEGSSLTQAQGRAVVYVSLHEGVRPSLSCASASSSASAQVATPPRRSCASTGSWSDS